jgi:hypothetical protein
MSNQHNLTKLTSYFISKINKYNTGLLRENLIFVKSCSISNKLILQPQTSRKDYSITLTASDYQVARG